MPKPRWMQMCMAFTHEESVEKIREEYERLSNPLVRFIEECCYEECCYQDVTDDAGITKNDFGDKLNEWMLHNGFHTLSATRIGTQMKNLGYEEDRRGKQKISYWCGLSWRSHMQ